MIMTISVQSNVINSFCIWVTMFDGKNQHPKNIFELSLMQQSHLGMNKSAKKGYTFCCCFGYHFSWFYLYSKGIIVSKTHRYQSETPSTFGFWCFFNMHGGPKVLYHLKKWVWVSPILTNPHPQPSKMKKSRFFKIGRG